MAKPQRQGDQIPVPPVIITIGIILSVVAVWFQYPGPALLFLATLVASFTTKYPLLTGPKDPKSLAPTVGNPAEQRKLNKYRFWGAMKTGLFTIEAPWPVNTSQITALGLALVAYTLPTDALNPHFTWVNAAATYLLVTAFTRTTRMFAAEADPRPSIEAKDYFANIGKDSTVTASLAIVVALGGGLSVTLWWVIEAANWYLIYPSWVFATGLMLLVLAATIHGALKTKKLIPWKQKVEARATWKTRWSIITNSKEEATLLHHRRVGENGQGWIDIHQSPPSRDGLKAWLPMPLGVPSTLPPETEAVFTSTPDLDENGEPVIPSRSALNFQTITWQGEPPSITDPNINKDELSTWLELMVRKSCIDDSGLEFDLIALMEPEALHTEDSPLAAWKIDYAVTLPKVDLPQSLIHLAGVVSGALNEEVRAFGDSLYFGPITDPEIKLEDTSIIDTLEAEAEREKWRKVWTDMVTNLQNPTYFPEQNEVLSFGDDKEIEVRLFMAPQGLESGDYFQKITPEKLKSGLSGKNFTSMGHFIAPKNKRRYPGSILLAWSEDEIPVNPTHIPASVSRRAAELVLGSVIAEAFHAAKLARPDVITATSLTSTKSRKHIWDLTIRLYDGVTLAKVKAAQETLRLAMHGCEWLRVTEAPEGCRIVLGAEPTSNRGVQFKNERAEFIVTSLDWEQALYDNKVTNTRGAVPALLSMAPLPKNGEVKKLNFLLPPGVGIAELRAAKNKLGSSTNNAFVDVQPGEKANQAVIMVAEESPLPSLIPFDWEEAHTSDLVPFASNMNGEPLSWDSTLR